MKKPLRRHGSFRRQTVEGFGGKEFTPEKDVCRLESWITKFLKKLSQKRAEICHKRELTEEIVREHDIAVSRACNIVSLTRSQYYYSSKKDDSEVIESFQDLAFKPHRRPHLPGREKNVELLYGPISDS